jgi:hypothetical protein
MYKSSSLTFLYKYLFPLLWAGGFLFGIVTTWGSEDQFLNEWSRGAAVMLPWGLAWLMLMAVRLRNVEANSTHLVIKAFNSQKTISYGDIEYVSQPAFISPDLILIKYRNHDSGEFEKILVIPSTSQRMYDFNFMKEHVMTQYIRKNIISSNPDYNVNSEPSRWKTVVFIFLTGLPAGILNFYSMNTHFKLP